MGKGLDKDPVVKELVLLASDIQLGQLQAPLGTYVLGVGRGRVAGSWDLVGSGVSPTPSALAGEGGHRSVPRGGGGGGGAGGCSPARTGRCRGWGVCCRAG